MALPAGSDDLPGPGLSLPQQNSPEVPFEIFPSLSVPPVFRGAPEDRRHVVTDAHADGRQGACGDQPWEMVVILDAHRQGLSVSAIARTTGFDRKTVRKYIERGLEAPAYGPRKPRQAIIDPFA